MNKKEIDFLKKNYKKEIDHKIRERILMLIYYLEGESSRKVGKRLQCDQKLVFYWKKRYFSEGISGLQTRQKSGKPRVLTVIEENKIKKKIGKHDPNNCWSTKRIADLIRKETNKTFTVRHVRKMLKRWDFHLVVPRPTFWQKASGEQIKNFWKKNPLPEKKIS